MCGRLAVRFPSSLEPYTRARLVPGLDYFWRIRNKVLEANQHEIGIGLHFRQAGAGWIDGRLGIDDARCANCWLLGFHQQGCQQIGDDAVSTIVGVNAVNQRASPAGTERKRFVQYYACNSTGIHRRSRSLARVCKHPRRKSYVPGAPLCPRCPPGHGMYSLAMPNARIHWTQEFMPKKNPSVSAEHGEAFEIAETRMRFRQPHGIAPSI